MSVIERKRRQGNKKKTNNVEKDKTVHSKSFCNVAREPA